MVSRLLDPNAYLVLQDHQQGNGAGPDRQRSRPARRGLIGLVGAKGAGRCPHNRGRPTEGDDAVVTPALGWVDLDGRRVSMVRG